MLVLKILILSLKILNLLKKKIKIVLQTFDGNYIGTDGSYIETYDENGYTAVIKYCEYKIAQFDSVDDAEKFIKDNKLSNSINQELAIFGTKKEQILKLIKERKDGKPKKC